MKKYKVAVVGATGVVGKEITDTLYQRKFPVDSIKLLASKNSVGQCLPFGNDEIDVEELVETSFNDVDYALFSAGGSISEKFCPFAVKSGAVCIDNTSHFRMVDGVPLVVPEVNPESAFSHKGIIANPNCSTAQLVLPLKVLHDHYGIERIVVSTYQSVSGAGKEGITELEQQSRANLSGQDIPPSVFQHHIAYNVIPQIDVFQDNGYTKEEMKMINETKKILNDDSIKMTATTVRVPVFVGHSESVNVQLKSAFKLDDVRQLMSDMSGVTVQDDPANSVYPTPRDSAGKDDVFVGRFRHDLSIENGLEFWCVSDNLRKGAALNAVQIAETLINV